MSWIIEIISMFMFLIFMVGVSLLGLLILVFLFLWGAGALSGYIVGAHPYWLLIIGLATLIFHSYRKRLAV